MKTAEEQLTKTVTDLIAENWGRPLSQAQFTHIAVPRLVQFFESYAAEQNAELRKEVDELKQQAGFAQTIQDQMMARIDQDIKDIESHDRSWNELKIKKEHQIKIHEATITRLHSLLERCKYYIEDYGPDSEQNKLLAEIETLTKKP